MCRTWYLAVKAILAVFAVALLIGVAPGDQAVAFYDWQKCNEDKAKEKVDALNMELVCYHSTLPGTGRHSTACKEDDRRVCKDLHKIKDHCGWLGQAWNPGNEYHKHYCEAGCSNSNWSDNLTQCH